MTDVLASADPGAPGAPTDPAAEPTQGVGTAVLEREELQSTDDGDASKYPVCPTCKSIYEEMRSGDDSGGKGPRFPRFPFGRGGR